MKYQTLNDILPNLDPNRRAVGFRKVLSEELQVDEQKKPIYVDGKLLKKIKLAPEYTWFTVSQVLERVDAIARGLQKQGITQGEKVIIYADNRLTFHSTVNREL